MLLALFILGAVLVVAPWTVRNYLKLGAFIPLRSAFAYNVWRGNHIGATGTCRNFNGISVDLTLPEDYAAYCEAHMVPDEVERDKFYAGEVKRFILENPAEYLRLTATRFYYLWWRDRTHPLTANPFYLLPWILILPFSALGAFLVRKEWRKWSLWIFQIIGFTVLFSLTIIVPRYRMPMYPALFLLTAVGLDYTFRKLSRYFKKEEK